MIKVVCGLLRNEDRVLIGKRLDNNPNWGGYWEFPGGKVDDGETEYEALIREFREELGIEIQPFHQFKSAIGDDVELIPFICDFVSGKASLGAHSEIKFVEIPNLKQYTFTPLTKDIITSVMGSYGGFFRKKKVK